MTPVQPEPVVADRSQPGETLRKAREGRGLALGDVAVSLNLSPVALHNLESGAFERLPGHTFARGYIRAYAKLLGMDQDLLVREFDQASGTDATGSSVNSLGRIEEPARVSQGLLRLVSLLALSVLVVAGFFWWQDRTSLDDDAGLLGGLEQVEIESANGTTQIHPLEPEDQAVELNKQEALDSSPEAEAAVAPVQPMVTAEPALAPVVPVDTAPAAAAVIAPEPAASVAAEPLTGAAVIPPAIAPAPVVPVAPAPVAASADATTASEDVVAAAGEGLLSISFTANCWVQVTDADGKVLISALKKPGEQVDLAVKLPLELRLGYASGAQVAFNGVAVDTAPFSTGETARLKLGQ
ncbi:helix-turn-helix domain-containing protein [Pseudomonas sp. N040]|uniref:helix-turn-helix domain-containing protein n=1 Tax=Pseudomonas sp. N040 TaxID=2785325 RepID=UPI0018A31312|nr:RodZ domain-containing protein [Pseudomonas sp. N040]MBF7731146.1 helix-turn-helix domain-containing protein [Pseudomonas sp. N040]MBW7014789.1 DUF4115 domain-containing protein [Pseudomonas sp. N040]